MVRMLTLLALLMAADAAAQPADLAAYQQLFRVERLGVAQPSESLRVGFEKQYRGVVPHAAFAVGVTADGKSFRGLSSGRGSAEDAETVALANCQREVREARATAACRAVAQDGVIVGEQAWRPLEDQLGPFRLSPMHWRHGPASAQGVVIWGHGLSATRLDARGAATPGTLAALNDAGWDVLRHDRHPMDDELNRSLAELMDGLTAVRAAGYRRIVLGGQSRGGWQSLGAASRQPEGVVAVMAHAPARHGTGQNGNNLMGAALDDFRRLSANLPKAGGPRVLVALFDGDDFDPDTESRANMLLRAGQDRASPLLVIWPEARVRGHSGGNSWRFTREYTGCVMALVTGPEAEAPRGLRRTGCP